MTSRRAVVDIDSHNQIESAAAVMANGSSEDEARMQLAAAQQAEEATLWDAAAAAYEACLTAIPGTDMAPQEPDLLTALGR